MKVLVIPTNRPESLQAFFDAWGDCGGWDKVIVVYDGSDFTKVNPLTEIDEMYAVFDWQQIDQSLGDRAWIISRKDSAIRSFGFLAAWHMGADYVLTLDDDCFPSCLFGGHDHNNFFAAHIANMQNHPVWVPSAGYRTRGLPYANLGYIQSVVNVGLWHNVQDWDSIQAMTQLAKDGEEYRRNCRHNGYTVGNTQSQTIWFGRQGNDIIPAGQLTPLCGMNLCFHRDAIPLMYFPLMGENSPYARFDDIWAGIIAKKIMDHLGWRMSVGEPHVEHKRASDPFKNLVKEAPGIAANEWFWEKIWGINLDGNATVDDCLLEMGLQLQNELHNISYLAQLGAALDVWRNLFIKGAIKL